ATFLSLAPGYTFQPDRSLPLKRGVVARGCSLMERRRRVLPAGTANPTYPSFASANIIGSASNVVLNLNSVGSPPLPSHPPSQVVPSPLNSKSHRIAPNTVA